MVDHQKRMHKKWYIGKVNNDGELLFFTIRFACLSFSNYIYIYINDRTVTNKSLTVSFFMNKIQTDIPSDSHYVSPFHIQRSRTNSNPKQQQQQQYMTFEPDGGGWNNIRMAMETVVGLAIATGRILVLPPEQRMYLLGQGHGKLKTHFSFMDFFPMKELANDNDGLTIITTEEFLDTVAMTGQLYDKYNGMVSFPPENRTNWDGLDVKPLKEWLRNVTYTPLWSPSECLAVFPATTKKENQIQLQQMLQTIQQQGRSNRQESIDQPIPVDATTIERLKESLTGRTELCLYNDEMQSANVLHFMCYHKMDVRMLVHFYAFLFFEDYREDLWMKRYVHFLCLYFILFYFCGVVMLFFLHTYISFFSSSSSFFCGF
jgi:hypothetical protein